MSTQAVIGVMGRVLVAADLVQRVYGRRLVHHVLTTIAAALLALILLAILIGGCLLASLYAGYAALLASGFEVYAAAGIVAAIAALFAMALAMVMYIGLRRAGHMADTPVNPLSSVSNVTTAVTGTFDAFVKGLCDAGGHLNRTHRPMDANHH